MSRIHVTLPCALLLVAGSQAAAQDFAPGYLDPEPILRAAEEAIGTHNLECVTVAGEAYSGAVGQQRLADKNIDWPRGAPLENYARTMHWNAGTMIETFDRTPGMNPASWKYGVGWLSGTPTQRNTRQQFVVTGEHAWHQDGEDALPMAARPEDAEIWQLDMWLNPHGFLKAARLPGANPVASWRWELGEMGRDGPTAQPERVRIVSITMLGKYRVDATINSQNLLQRIHTWVGDPVLGDMNYEHEFFNDEYADLGDGIRFPTRWHSHQGWDDNYQAQSINTGHNSFGGILDDMTPNDCNTDIEVPESVLAADHSLRIDTQELADGVVVLGGASHNSVAVEFDDFVTVIEAPIDEARSLAVIETVVDLFPGKPIRFVVNTHQKHDHIGGLRTYMHIGATIVTQRQNFAFYTNDVLNYAPRTMAPDMVSLWPPTELAEGYYYELVTENYVISDGQRNLNLSYVHPLDHVEGMLMAYLPGERMVIEADLFDTHEPLPAEPTQANLALLNQVRRLGLEVDTIVPIHGRPAAWSEFTGFVE